MVVYPILVFANTLIVVQLQELAVASRTARQGTVISNSHVEFLVISIKVRQTKQTVIFSNLLTLF